jgi:hypothetical protein
MSVRCSDVHTLDDLRSFVHGALCEKENLLGEQFSISEMQLVRRGRPCGLQFSLHGPRSVRLGAVWAADHNVVYLYDTQGRRYARVELPRRLRTELAAA